MSLSSENSHQMFFFVEQYENIKIFCLKKKSSSSGAMVSHIPYFIGIS